MLRPDRREGHAYYRTARTQWSQNSTETSSAVMRRVTRVVMPSYRCIVQHSRPEEIVDEKIA